MNDFEKLLAAKLFRADCPDSLALGEYHLELLDKAQAQTIRAHLAHCPHCRQEIAGLETYLTTVSQDIDVPVIEPPGVIKRLIARLRLPGLDWEGGQSPLFAPIGVRGEGPEARLYAAGDWQISLEIQEAVEQPEHKTIVGLVLGPEAAWQITLQQEEHVAASATANDIGNFIIDNVRPGTYTLLLRSVHAEILVPDLTIDET